MPLLDGSRLIVEACVQAGADSFVGYPITPANLLYLYSSRRFPLVLPAPDEISTLQWMSGLSATGHLPVTATSFPGFALMLESINMAYMMELPMIIILAQRLGPATGTATCGAQGDLLLVHGQISGGYPVPTFCISGMLDCWALSAQAVKTAVSLRTPVILLTSKEMVMTLRSFDIKSLPPLSSARLTYFEGESPYHAYSPGSDGVPLFLPLGNDKHQVRFTASTHDKQGYIQNTSPEAMQNTKRLQQKLLDGLPEFTFFEYAEEKSDVLLVAFDVSAQAAREAVCRLRENGKPVSLLVPKTLFPVSPSYFEIMGHYSRVIIVEENLNGQYREILFGQSRRKGLSGVNKIGSMISPEEIIREVLL